MFSVLLKISTKVLAGIVPMFVELYLDCRREEIKSI